MLKNLENSKIHEIQIFEYVSFLGFRVSFFKNVFFRVDKSWPDNHINAMKDSLEKASLACIYIYREKRRSRVNIQNRQANLFSLQKAQADDRHTINIIKIIVSCELLASCSHIHCNVHPSDQKAKSLYFVDPYQRKQLLGIESGTSMLITVFWRIKMFIHRSIYGRTQ